MKTVIVGTIILEMMEERKDTKFYPNILNSVEVTVEGDVNDSATDVADYYNGVVELLRGEVTE